MLTPPIVRTIPPSAYPLMPSPIFPPAIPARIIMLSPYPTFLYSLSLGVCPRIIFAARDKIGPKKGCSPNELPTLTTLLASN